MTYPIPMHKSWEIVDPSSLVKYMTCERSYFFTKLLGWRFDAPSVHLTFGRALHRAFEVLREEGFNQAAIDKAIEMFELVYRQDFGEQSDFDNAPKNPARFRELIVEYVAQYAVTDSNLELIQQEQVIPVLIDETHTLWCKLDSIYRDSNGMYLSIDPKTTGRKSKHWYDQWANRFQFKAYLHLLYSYYTYQKVKGIIVDGIVITSKGNEFLRTGVSSTPEQMQLWQYQTLQHLKRLEKDMQLLAETKPSDPYMKAFPQRETACVGYGLCPFFHICRARPNPVRDFDRIPEGYIVDFWDPRVDDTPKEGTQ